jgi:aldehyde dehydrogenase (NAD+)
MMAKKYEALIVGSAIDDLDVGPLISERQKDIVCGFIKEGRDLVKVAEGNIAQNVNNKGYFVLPTLFGKVPSNHKLAQEEIFGPVQTLIPFKDEDEAIAIANGTDYGLVASIWTNDGSRQMRLAKKIDTGQVFINNYGAGGGVELPFGGVGKSGHGREKGFEALYGFSKLKTVAAYHG